jgi:EAL domain-containing protein (putative c-di-GMP-specific phosphodiesterase class I)
LPIDALKIDGSFVRDIDAGLGADDGILAKAIISLGHGLRLKVIAEGVESEAQLAFLKAHQCDEVQGFYYSTPVPPDECALLFSTGRAVPIG